MRRDARRNDYDQLVSSLVPVVDRDRVVVSDFADAAETLAMLGSPIRVQLLWVLSQGERDVTGLAEAIGASLATTSHHLRRMRAARLITSRADGRHQFYCADDPHVIELIAQVVDHHADLRLRAAVPTRAAGERSAGGDVEQMADDPGEGHGSASPEDVAEDRVVLGGVADVGADPPGGEQADDGDRHGDGDADRGGDQHHRQQGK